MAVHGEIRTGFGRFQSMDCSAAQSGLDQLVDAVAAGCGRVTITGSSPASECVLISRAELESLEKAIAILSTTTGAEAMREEIVALAAQLESRPQ